MSDRPIIFSAPMVRALLDGRKSQTRRLLKKPAAMNALAVFGPAFLLLPGNVDLVGYATGDRLWVRENWNASGPNWGKPICEMRSGLGQVHYAATDDGAWQPYWGGWKPSIHMPRWASRLTLTVTEVRVQRLRDISEADAAAEGCPCQTDEELAGMDPRGWFADLWNSLHGPEAWDANPWVAAISFEAHRTNINAMGDAHAA